MLAHLLGSGGKPHSVLPALKRRSAHNVSFCRGAASSRPLDTERGGTNRLGAAAAVVAIAMDHDAVGRLALEDAPGAAADPCCCSLLLRPPPPTKVIMVILQNYDNNGQRFRNRCFTHRRRGRTPICAQDILLSPHRYAGFHGVTDHVPAGAPLAAFAGVGALHRRRWHGGIRSRAAGDVKAPIEREHHARSLRSVSSDRIHRV